MIRLLAEADLGPAVALLAREPEMNLYLLGNMESGGVHSDYIEFWGDFDPHDRLRAVLNRYMSGWVVYGLPEADWTGLAHQMDIHPERADRLQDNPGGVESFLPFLHRYYAARRSVEELMALADADFHPIPSPSDVCVRRAGLDDLPRLVTFYADAEKMTRTPAAVERPLRLRRVWIAEQAGILCSAALTNAETATLAMVGGVYTRPQARNQGLSQAVCSALCQELLTENRRPVLYWEAPAAGAVYRKLGFRRIGQWCSVWLAEEGAS